MVIGREETGANAQYSEDFTPEAGDKLCTAITDNVLCKAMEVDNLIHPKLDDFLGEG